NCYFLLSITSKGKINSRLRTCFHRFNAHKSGARMDFPTSLHPAFSRTLAKAKALAAGDNLVVIYGDTGSAKEPLANAIHAAGPRAGEPFIAINTEAIAEGILESEIFGHEKGAFTDAVTSSPGACGLAGKGTLFIDEFHRI